MKVLVIGNGGREHALAWRLAQSLRVQKIYVAPGNAATHGDDRYVSVPIRVTDSASARALREWAQAQGIGLTVVGPEVALAAGVVDEFRAHGLRIVGPTQAAAQLESSKDFSKAFMLRHGIPTAEYQSFTDAAAAHDYVNAKGAPIVVKADGLAAGKGVVVAMNLAEAHAAIDDMLLGNSLNIAHSQSDDGAAMPRVVVEEFLQGEEASFIVLTDGKTVIPLASSQDHKRLRDGDLGPNTGGMGAYSPAPIVTPQVHARVMREIIQPVIRGMAQEGQPYSGFLYAGLMMSETGDIKTLEFNCRLGDPETQPILMRLKSDLFELLLAASEERLAGLEINWDKRYALGVVMAAHGYPASVRTGDLIRGIPHENPSTPNDDMDHMVFQAGTRISLDDTGRSVVQTDGGRVLCVTAMAATLKAAHQHAYELIANIHFDGAQFRRDIGDRARRKS